MRPREELAEIFSTFLQFDGDRPQTWLADGRLRRSMQQAIAAHQPLQTTSSEQFWALYWHKHWQEQPNPVAKGHLAAFVQEACYWASQKTARTFNNLQYGLADCFQMAIAQFDKVLKGFDAQWGTPLKSYAGATFASLIRETLRQQQEIDICTDWALLRKISQKRLSEALRLAGLSAETVDSYLLAWNSFKTIYTPTQASGTRQLSKPTVETWEAIARFYNQERAALPAATVASLEKWMLNCAKAARSYLYPVTVSINAPKPGQEESEFLDDLPQTAQSSLLQEMIAEEERQERQEQRSQLEAILKDALTQLDPESQTILDLYYRQQATQQDMARQLDTKQYTISRRLTKARQTLLKALALWMRDTLHISPTSDLLTLSGDALEDWLKSYYGQFAIAESVSSR